MTRLLLVEPTLESWTNAARWLVGQKLPPETVGWKTEGEENTGDLLTAFLEAEVAPPTPPSFSVPRDFAALARELIHHRSPERFGLLYRLLWRLLHENRALLELHTDKDVREAQLMAKAVRNDIHRMHAFVRFRKIGTEDGGEHWIAWHRPDHRIVRPAAPFFTERFGDMAWSILTPDESVSWDGKELRFGPGQPTPPAGEDALERMWRAYYRSVSNPARVNGALLRQHLPTRHWHTLPEAREIPALLAESDRRTGSMLEGSRERTEVSAQTLAASAGTWEELREAALGCVGCPLHCEATQAVFGTGRLDARCMLVGEQPGKEEDLQGRPFIGPAGQLLDEALALAGIAREDLYVTNAMKHFKFVRVGERRLDRPPSSPEIGACRPWLVREAEFVKPEILVCLGATAAQSVLGRRVTLREVRGQFVRTPFCERTFVTVHPSSILRTPEGPGRAEAWERFVRELQEVGATLRET